MDYNHAKVMLKNPFDAHGNFGVLFFVVVVVILTLYNLEKVSINHWGYVLE